MNEHYRCRAENDRLLIENNLLRKEEAALMDVVEDKERAVRMMTDEVRFHRNEALRRCEEETSE